MDAESLLLPHMERVLNDEMSLPDFVQWFSAALWEIDSSETAAEDIVDLAWTVEQRFDERRALDAPWNDLKRWLADDVRAVRPARASSRVAFDVALPRDIWSGSFQLKTTSPTIGTAAVAHQDGRRRVVIRASTFDARNAAARQPAGRNLDWR